MIETTVVGWDGGASAQAALEWAIAQPQGRNLRLVKVAGAGVSNAQMFAPNAPAATARVALMDEAEKVRKRLPDVNVTSELLFGDPVEELARLSTAETLVVVGAGRQATGASRWSIGARLAGAATGPVAVIRAAPPKQGTGIAVGVDGTESSIAALAFAAEEAHRTGQELHAIRAWQEPPLWADAQVPDPDYLRSLEQMYGDILDDALTEVGRTYSNLPVRRSLIRGPAPHVLLAASRGAALIVVGNHGLTGLKRFLLGSVSHFLVRKASAPVLIVPAGR